MTSKLTLLSFCLGLLPFGVAESCGTGDATCAARAAALLQHKSRQSPVPVDAGGESLYGPMMIEGRFHWVHDPQFYANKSSEEVARLQAEGMQSIREALAEAVGFGLVASDIELRFESPSGLLLTQVQGTADAICVFTFQCPPGASPEEVTGSMSKITAQSFLNILIPKVGQLGSQPFAFTATFFMGATPVNSTLAPTSTNAPTSSMPISSPMPISSSYVPATTTEPPLDFHPCKSLDDYRPDAKMSEYGWCEGSQPNMTEQQCLDGGCKAYGYPDHPYCSCSTEEACATLGFEWKYHTCKDEMRMYQSSSDYLGFFKQAMDNGTCDGIVTTWHVSLAESMEWPARKCCASWPQTFCEPDATLPSPCKDASDFLPDKVTGQGISCMDYVKQWWSEYWLLKNASAAGSCDGMDLPWAESLKDWVVHPAKECCASFPATICDKDASFMTPCRSPEEFAPEKVLYEHCDTHHSGTVDNVSCQTSGCSWHEAHHWCECRDEASCGAAGGRWHTQTCKKETEQWDLRMHAALQEAIEDGGCSDLDYDGDVEAHISWPAKKCCSSFPATVCQPTARRMTPCKDEADFMAGNVLSQWCDWGAQVPNASTCRSHKGCHGDANYCHCEEESSCLALGGRFMSRTCGEDLSEQEAAYHEALEAGSAGRCSDVSYHGTTVEDLISWSSRKCCASYPANVCHKDLQAMTPCKDAADFLPSNILNEWCELHGQIPAACATTPGCHASEHHCHCGTAESCAAVGGSWTQRTCEVEVREFWDSQTHLHVQMAASDGCEDVDLRGQSMKDMLRYPASKCCASYPASVCDPTAKKMTPCKDEADFMPAQPLHEWCDFHGSYPDEDTCRAHGCNAYSDGCSCDTSEKCLAVGAEWKVSTCETDIGHWSPEQHRALQEARQNGTCGVHTMFGDLTGMINYPAEKCCASFPATLCDPTARLMTPCKDDADYTPDKEMWAHCDFWRDGAVMPSEAVCNDQEGCYGGQGWCHCEGKTSCEAVGGFWNAHTCAMEVSQWRPEQHKVLQKADEQGTCIDLEVNGMRAQDMVNWPAQMCCMSFPASVCDKELKATTPCLHDQEFQNNKTQWAWCDGLYPTPPEADCHAQGCTGNEHYCHCETETACVALGGNWKEHQCWQDLQWMAAEVHKGIAKAIHQGTCEDVEAYHSKLEYAVDWLGSNCCLSGMSVCQALAAGVSPYESPYEMTR